MKRVYFAMLPLDTRRPGGVWWFRDMQDVEVFPFVQTMRPVCTALRISDSFPTHDLMHIAPPQDAERVI